MLDKKLQQLWFKIKKMEDYPVAGIMILSFIIRVQGIQIKSIERTVRASRTVWPKFFKFVVCNPC